MNKTFNINLGGYPFIIDDDAYTLLSNYFDSIRTAFSSDDLDTDELVADLESRAAEILTEILAQTGGSIVSVEYVQMVMRRMGKVEEITEELAESPVIEDSQSSEESSNVLPPPLSVKRRLYRDPIGKMLGGVCTGLSVYLGIDVVWIRLIFILACFASVSIAFLVYIILWIVIPNANTPMRQMQLRGIQPTVDNIGKSVNSFFQGMTSSINLKAENSGKKAAHIFTQICANLGKGLLLLISILSIMGTIICGIGIIAGITALIGIQIGGTELIDKIMAAIVANYPIWQGANPEIIFTFAIASFLCGGLLCFGLFYTICGSLRHWETKKSWLITLITAWIISLCTMGLCRLLLYFP